MIKTYRYNVLCNSASHILNGPSGNSMRYDFTHGNIAGNKYPEITLRNKYAQDLLESHELFSKGKVSLIRTTLEESDIVDEPAKKTTKKSQKEEVAGIRTAEEVINYINNRFDKNCRTLETAMKHADKAGLIFPDYGKE